MQKLNNAKLLISYKCTSYIDCWRLQIIFASSMDPDQDQPNFGPDLNPNHLTLIVFSKELFEKGKFEKSQKTTEAYKITQHANGKCKASVFFVTVTRISDCLALYQVC